MKRLFICFVLLLVFSITIVIPVGLATDSAEEGANNSIYIVAPGEGDILPAGSEQTVLWKTSGAEGGFVALYYRTENNTKWQHISTVSNTGAYMWELPLVETHHAAIRAVWLKSENDDTVKYAEGISGEFAEFEL